jgi:hypothetical protein
LGWNSIKNRAWLYRNYPGLEFRDELTIWGKLCFNACYNGKKNEIIFNPRAVLNQKNYFVEQYDIRIYKTKRPFPLVYEIGGRIINAKKKWRKKSILDVHLYGDTRSACLCPKPEQIRLERKGIDLPYLIDELVLPFFFQQAYFERNGKWINEYSHGHGSIFEYFYRNRNILPRDELLHLTDVSLKTISTTRMRFYRKSKCFCGTKKRFMSCCYKKFSIEAKNGFKLCKDFLQSR